MVRQAVIDFVAAGPLPSEEVPVAEIAEAQRLLEQITAPVSDEEARMMIMAFGPDTCFGLMWTLLHLIESAPGARTNDYSENADNDWVRLLEARRAGA
jgi:hypothetical protein